MKIVLSIFNDLNPLSLSLQGNDDNSFDVSGKIESIKLKTNM